MINFLHIWNFDTHYWTLPFEVGSHDLDCYEGHSCVRKQSFCAHFRVNFIIDLKEIQLLPYSLVC